MAIRNSSLPPTNAGSNACPVARASPGGKAISARSRCPPTATCSRACKSKMAPPFSTVTKTNNDGPGSLRQAIADANAEANPQGSVIVFSPSLKGKTVGLTSGELEIVNSTNRISVLGASLPRGSDDPVDLAGGVTISGTDNSRILFTDFNTDVLLRNLTLTEAHPETTAGEGGAIFSGGLLDICDSSIVGNRTRDVTSGSSKAGAGMFLQSSCSTLIYRSTISDNHCGSGTVATGPAGGIFNFGELVIVDSTIFRQPCRHRRLRRRHPRRGDEAGDPPLDDQWQCHARQRVHRCGAGRRHLRQRQQHAAAHSEYHHRRTIRQDW